MASAAAPLLYVHPCGHLNDLVVPAGALSCMNAVAVPKLGRYAFEVSDEELRGARILATDLHWALGLAGMERLLAHARAVNPTLRTVVGGISAGHYGRRLLEQPNIDFVVRGDSEIAFASLVDQLIEGVAGEPVANVLDRTSASELTRRMTNGEFDATNVLDAHWFPTHAKVSQWDAAAFGMGRTIAVARGCPMRCPACYGSYASTFGPGVLLRSPAGLVRQLRQAEAMHLRNLRLVLGKPSVATLAALVEGLASAGPFRFETTVGLYLCRAPSPADLDALEAAFEGGLTLSLVPPAEHVPGLDPRRLEEEMAAWRSVAERVSRSRRMTLDVWTIASSDPASLSRDFLSAPSNQGGAPTMTPGRVEPATGGQITVSLGAVWNISRPTDEPTSPSLADMRALSDGVWTFYAARLLSPALAELLEPFALLDELDHPPENASCPADERAPYFERIMDGWREHRLPVVAGLCFYAVPLQLARASASSVEDEPVAHEQLAPASAGAPHRGRAPAHGIRTHGALECVDVLDGFAQLGAAVRLWRVSDHTGERLVTRSPIGPMGEALAFVPAKLPESATDPCPRDWIAALGRHGLVVLKVEGVAPTDGSAPTNGSAPTDSSVAPEAIASARALSLQVTLRVQQAEVALLGATGQPLRHGKVDLRYLSPPGSARRATPPPPRDR